MLQIEKKMKPRRLPEDVMKHLALLPVGDIKVGISLFTFVILNLIAVFPIVADPFIKELFVSIVPFLLFINSWAITLIVRNVYSTQLETVLFFGFLGAISALCFFILSQKLAYFVVGMESISFLTISIMVYVCTILYFISYYNRKVNLNKVHKDKKTKAVWPVLYTSPAIGYIVYHGFIKESQFLHLAMAFLFMLFVIFFIYISVKFFHKYFFIKANIHFANFQGPGKKETKQALAKGKEIKVK